MNVLFLLRAPNPGLSGYARRLAVVLESMGHGVSVEDAADWLPAETGAKVDRPASERLKRLAGPFDLVHAFGYRAAWACAEAFGSKEAWVYSAHDMPKTTHRVFISHLNEAQAGICSSRAVFRALDEALALDLSTVYPGVPVSPGQESGAPGDRWAFGEESFLIAAMGRFVPERGFRSLIAAMPDVWAEHPHVRLVISGEGPEATALQQLAAEHDVEGGRIRFEPMLSDPAELILTADLVVVPSTRAGFSMTAIEAMALGKPVLLRDTGGLREIVDPDISGFLFQTDDELAANINELIDLPMTLETVGHGARLRVLERFTIEKAAGSIVAAYETIVGEER